MSFVYTQELIDRALSYSAYRQGINDILAQPAVNADAERLRPYTAANVAIMNKYDASCRLSSSLLAALSAAPATTWLVITEGWCGDAAFNVPAMAAIENVSRGKVTLRLVLRDSNLALMDAHLTDGGRSIPKLVILNDQLQEAGTWGPRPVPLQALMHEWKEQGLGLKDLIPKVHGWYDADGTQTLQQELIKLISGYTG